MKPKEVVLSSEGSGELWNVMVWDASNGSQLMSYRDGVSAPRTLCLIGQDYLMSAEKSKPILNVWAVSKKEQEKVHIVTTHVVTALTTTRDGCYCIGAIRENINIWQISSGRLMAVLSKHYQQITTLKMTDDSSHLISAGKDGMVIAWLFPQVLSASGDGEPRHTWAKHSLPVTDIHVGSGGWQARVFSCSLDNTCKIFSIASGEMLVSVELGVVLTCIVADPAETAVYVGSQQGSLYQINLLTPPRTLNYSLTSEEMKKREFVGHTDRIECLDVSLSGKLLASGSDDEKVMIWDTESKQCLRVLHHKGCVNNLLFTLAPAAMLSGETHTPSLPICQFKRATTDSSQPLKLNLEHRLYDLWGRSEQSSQKLREDNDRLRKSNASLYKLVANDFVNSI